MEKLQGRAVAYINTDTCSTGPVLEIPASPLLWDMAKEIAKLVGPRLCSRVMLLRWWSSAA